MASKQLFYVVYFLKAIFRICHRGNVVLAILLSQLYLWLYKNDN